MARSATRDAEAGARDPRGADIQGLASKLEEVERRALAQVPEVDSRCRLLIVPLFRSSSRFESLILSHRSRFQRYM